MRKQKTQPETQTFKTRVQIEAIRALDLRAALIHYGVDFGRSGFAHCPFHGEKTPSFKIHKNKYKCFGCGATGDLIDYIRQKQNCNLTEAVEMICRDFKIDAKPTLADIIRIDEMRMANARSKKTYRALWETYLDAHDAYLDAYERRERAALLPGGETPENDAYVDAQFALMAADEALERAHCAVVEYAAEHPQALPIAPQTKAFSEKLKWVREEKRSPFGDYIRQDRMVRDTNV